MTFMHEPKKLFEAMPKGMIWGRTALVPFSNNPGYVARVLQSLCNGNFLHRHAKSRFLIERSGGIKFVAETGRNPPRQ